MIGARILDEIISQPMFRMECPSHPEASCLAIWNGNVDEQIEAVVVQALREAGVLEEEIAKLSHP